MNELFDALPHQPDAALTNIIPVSPNKFRFLFVWPGSNPLMTYDRVGRSFGDRFAAFAGQLKPMATGYCLPSQNMFFGTTTYGVDEVNVAYRDIEVHYQFGGSLPARAATSRRRSLSCFRACQRITEATAQPCLLPILRSQRSRSREAPRTA